MATRRTVGLEKMSRAAGVAQHEDLEVLATALVMALQKGGHVELAKHAQIVVEVILNDLTDDDIRKHLN